MSKIGEVPTGLTKKSTYTSNVHSANLSAKVSTLYNEKQFFDVTLVCGVDEISVPAHRFILIVSSDFFLAAFRSNLDEIDNDKIKLPEMDGDLMKSIVDFMYTGTIELCSETVEALLKAGDFLQINSLITACSEFMLKNIDTSNCLGIAATAKLYRLDELYKKATKFACENLTEVGKGEEFLSLNAAQLKDFLPNIAECFATEVFFYLCAWVQHDKDSRLESVLELFSLVKFKLLSPEFIVKNKNMICEVEGGNELVLDWLSWHLSSNASYVNCNVCNDVNSSALVYQSKLYIVGSSDQNSFKFYDWRNGHTETLPQMSIPRQRPGVIVHGDYLYAVGGTRNGVWCREAYRYSFYQRIWSHFPNLNDTIVNIQLYATPEYLYAVGDNSAESMNLQSGFPTWMVIQSMVCGCRYFGRCQQTFYTFSEEKNERIIKMCTKVGGWQVQHNIKNLEIYFVDRMGQNQYFFNKGEWYNIKPCFF